MRVDNLPPRRLGVYVEAFDAGLGLLVSPFVFELLRFYGVSLCTLTSNSLRLILGFLVICFLVEVSLLFV